MEIISGLLKQKHEGKEYECLLCPYAVGDIFITTNELDPKIRYKGTTWQKIEEETYLMSASGKYPVKSVCGENEHILSVEEMPSHTHEMTYGYGTGNSTTYNASVVGKNLSITGGTYKTENKYTGGNQPHNNMPKSFSVYFWLRVG